MAGDTSLCLFHIHRGAGKPSTLGQREGWLHWLSYGPLANVAGLRIGDVALIACLWSRAAGLVGDGAGDRVIGPAGLNL